MPLLLPVSPSPSQSSQPAASALPRPLHNSSSPRTRSRSQIPFGVSGSSVPGRSYAFANAFLFCLERKLCGRQEGEIENREPGDDGTRCRWAGSADGEYLLVLDTCRQVSKMLPKMQLSAFAGEKSEGKTRATVELKLAAKVCRQSCSLS